ncbi:MAG: hypothetical protein ACYTAS_03985 [Planctomycetota bacterium]|jgi:chromate transport protein ChrA
MKRRIVITAIVVAVAHFVLASALLLFAVGAGMEALDNPDYQESGTERVAARLVEVLFQPLWSLWTPWMSKNMPRLLEWVLSAANSLLWGFAIALIAHIPALVKRRQPNNNGVHSVSESRANASSGNE